MMETKLKVTTVVVFLTFLGTNLVQSVTTPPKIVTQGPKDIFYHPRETVKMECVANGDPKPSYYWKRAEVLFSPEGNDDRFVKQKDAGTLIINNPEDKDEGLYQCFATNSQGTATTIKFNLKMAKLDEFAASDPITHTPQLGAALRLDCQSPASVPDAQIYWMTGDDRQPISWDSRVTMDYEDRLYFTHVTAADANNGKAYQCVAYNSVMRKSVVGRQQIIKPQGTNEVFAPMQKAWPTSRFDEKGLVGSDFKMKCIFSGNPTPKVRWKRQDSKPFSNRVQTGNSGGQELVIRNLQFEDAGTYLCDASKDQDSTLLEMSINLNVNSRPTWKVMPKDLAIIENATATFECSGEAVPRPAIFWFVNGEPLETALKNDVRLDRRFQKLKPEVIVLQNVNKLDSMVFQCNVTNIHGYLWAEAYLNVLSEAPTIVKRPQDTKVAEGQPFVLVCHVTGKPNPIITWYKDDQQVTGGRYHIKEIGSLSINMAVLSDAGDYRCHARNKYGEEDANATLIVRRKTVIQWKPLDLEVQRGMYAKFTCSGTTDPEEATSLQTSWLKDHQPIETGTRMYINIQDHSLTISGSEPRDTGTYTCVVSSYLDSANDSARLVVTDVPEPPTNVIVFNDCGPDAQAVVQWIAGSFNNAPIEYFIIEYMTKQDPKHWVFANHTDYRKDTAEVPLHPGMDYSFRVTSYNKIGASQPSERTTKACVMPRSTPLENPRNVRTIGDKQGMIHIEWTPVPPEYQGDQNFSYVITLQRYGDSDQARFTDIIRDWRRYDVIYPSAGEPYTRYVITVKSLATDGYSAQPVQEVYGHSYESMPTLGPYNLIVQNIESDNALFTWEFDRSQIGKIGSQICGEFRGFKIQFWERGRQADTMREYNVSPEESLANSTSNMFSVTVHNILPNSQVEARVALLNNFYVSKPSEVFSFVTPPGLPGPVERLEDLNVGDNHVNLQWWPPLDSKGDIIGFDISYQEVRELLLEELQDRIPQIDDPYATTAMLSGLVPNTKYRIHVWARTEAGRGEGFYIERTTASPGAPMIPRFTIAGVGSTFINVSWWRDAYQSSGSVVYVEYRKQDGAEWFSTVPDVSKEWAKLNFLEPGTKYNIRIVTTNGVSQRLSEEEDVITDGAAKAYDVVENIGWFLGMMFALILEIGLVIMFVICYRRGFRLHSREDKITTYRDGHETYTDKMRIERAYTDSSDKPGGYNNDIYKTGYDDDDNNDGFEDYDYENRDDEHYDDQDYYRNDERAQSDYRDGDGHEDFIADDKKIDDYEPFNIDAPKNKSYDQTDHADPASYPPLSVNNFSDDTTDHRPYHGEGHDERKQTTREKARVEDYVHRPSTRKSSKQKDTQLEQKSTGHRSRHQQNRDGRQQSRHSSKDKHHSSRQQRDNHYNDGYDHNHDQDDYRGDHGHGPGKASGVGRVYDDGREDKRHAGGNDSKGRVYDDASEDQRHDHDHHSHHADPDHDHDKCDEVVEEFKRYSGAPAARSGSRDNEGHGYSSTMI